MDYFIGDYNMKTMMILSFLMIFQTGFNQLLAQGNSNCNCTECNQFDFWVGNWKAVWQDSSGTEYSGNNKINKILGGCVIAENFDGNPGVDFTGKSFSVYNKKKKIWEQTWVDSNGGYMLFTGGMQDDKMILSRTVNTQKGTILQRMVFYNITSESFDWNWEASLDNGINWQLNRLIDYKKQ